MVHPAHDESATEQLVAERAEAGAETWFGAIEGFPYLIPHPQLLFEAKRAEAIGPVKITREVGLEAETGASFSAPGVVPVSVRIAPSGPFSGSAEYEEEPGGVAWTGTLAVELPGLPRLPLTGPGFEATTCLGEGPAARPCERSPLGPLLP